MVQQDQSTMQLHAEWMEQAGGFRILSQHTTAGSALKVLGQEKPNVVLVDIDIPDLQGIACITCLKPIIPETQFVGLTIDGNIVRVLKALAAGANGCLLRPTGPVEMVAALRDVHEGGSPLSGRIARELVQSFQRRHSPPPALYTLTGREREVLELLTQGFLYKEIAALLQLRSPTVNTYICRVYKKLGVGTRSRATALYKGLAT